MNRNRKMLIVLVALCLIIGVGVAGTLMMAGGSEAVGCEAQFDGSSELLLYSGVDSEDSIYADIRDLPSPLTVTEETEGADIKWYCLEGENWPESLADYHYVKSTGWTLIEKDETPIEAVELTGDIVINSEDTQLSANVVDDKTVTEIENGLSIPQADANVSRETYCFDIHAEEEASTTVTVSGIAKPGSTVSVYHMYDDTDYTKFEILPCTVGADGSVTFTTESFSEFYFTVDFHNGEKTYSIAGMSSVLLSEVFAQLEIDEDATQAESVVFSDETLLSVERQEDGDWLLTSLQAFTTEETLTITFADGHQLVMNVTDAIVVAHTDSCEQRNTNEPVEFYKNGGTRNIQIFGTLYDSGITVWYQTWAAIEDYGMKVTMKNESGNTLASTSTKYECATGTQIVCDSKGNVYWYHVSKRYDYLPFTDSKLRMSNSNDLHSVTLGTITNQFGRNGSRAMEITAHPTAIGTNDYCTIARRSTFSVGTTTRNVQLQVYNYEKNQYEVKANYNNLLFNDKKMSQDHIVVSGYDKSQYEVTIEISGSTYIVKLNPKTAVVTATAMPAGLGDKSGVGITGVQLTGGFYHNDVSGSETAKARFLLNTQYTMTASVKEGYVFAGWYDGDSSSANLVSTDKTYTATLTSQNDVTLYARAVEINPLYVDSYYRAGNGRYGCAWGIDGDPSSFKITFTGSGVTNNYANDKNWYIVANHDLISGGTGPRNIVIDGIETITDTNAMAIGTNTPGDPYYCGTYNLNGDNIPFWKAGVGLDFAALDYVYYDAGSGTGGQVWRYGYQWTYSTWTYDFTNRSWTEHKHPVAFPAKLPGIPIPADPGRVNFLYKQAPEPGTNSFYLRYYANGLGVDNVPEMQVEKNLAYDSYWFTVAGLADLKDDKGNIVSRPTRANHTFIGWSTDRHHDPSDTDSADIWTPEKFNKPITSDEDFKNRQIEVKANTILNPERLYAIWQKNDTSITVTYHWNDGRDGDDTYKSKTYDKAHALILSDKPDAPTREGYTFAGWYYDEDCNDGSEVKWNGLEKLYADTEIYARWVVNITGKSMQASLGDKKGDNTIGGGIKEIKIVDSNVNSIDSSLIAKKKITGTYDAYEEFKLQAVVNDGYRFIGWYDSNALDSQGRPTGKLVSSDPVLTGKAEKNTTYYARAVEESLLAVDYYVRLSNGRHVYAHDWMDTRKIYGVEVSKDYSNNKNWYLIAQYGLINDGTKDGTVHRKFKDDTNAMLIGTGNANDTFYSDYKGFKTSYFFNKDKGHYDFSYYDYTDSNGKVWKVPFKRAGIGLNLVSLNNVYYDTDMRSSGAEIGGQTWKYGYQWKTSYWLYSIKNGWVQKTVEHELEDIPVYEDEGRINFVYEMETREGNNSFYLKYHSNLKNDKLVSNIPADQSMKNIDETEYFFGIDGLVPKATQPACPGYQFIGWSTNPNHDPEDVTGDDIYTYDKYKQSEKNGDFDWREIEVKLAEGKNSGTVHLYAIWKQVLTPTEGLSVTFDLNYLASDSDENTADISNVWKVVNVKKGEIASDPGTPTRDGYTFAGWYFTRENDPGTEYDRANTRVNNNLVVYAKWNPDYVVHYYIEGTTTKVAPDKVVPNNAVGSVVSETAPDFAGCKFVGNSRDESITIKYSYKDNEIIFYYTKDADYTIKYYKGSVSDANYLDECTVTGTVDDVITVPAGSDIGQLDYKKPVGYKSGVLKDTNVKVKADNSSVVRVVYTADTVEYTVEAYIMGTDGQYPASPTQTEKKPALTNTEVTATTDTAYWVDDAEKDAFTFDSANENNVISGTVAGDNSTVLKVYISRNQYTLTWDVTKDDDTTYKVGDTTKYYYGQAVTEPEVEVPDYYDFDNWEKGGVDWPDTMPKNDVNISGELIRQRTDLVISKSGMEQGESAIFTVTGKGLGSGMKVIVPSGESVKIKNLPVGESYTITEQNDWSWKYEAHSSVTRTLTAGNTETVHFSNVPKLIKWLTDEFYVDNKFGIWR